MQLGSYLQYFAAKNESCSFKLIRKFGNAVRERCKNKTYEKDLARDVAPVYYPFCLLSRT